MITLSESAAQRVSSYLDKRGSGIGLRVGISRTGCSGYAYVIDYADELEDGDVQFDSNGVTVVVNEDDLTLIDGTEVDFIKDGLNEAFKFRNPNVRGECGCGESFTV